MNADEKRVLDHLNYLGYKQVVFEPDGNVPPDFLVNGNIAIEVRRLNQNYFNGANTKGLEKDDIKLKGNIDRLLNSFDASIEDENWSIGYEFARPIGKWQVLEPKIRRALQYFIESPNKQKGPILETKNFRLDILHKVSNPHRTMFRIGIILDKDAGGWVIPTLVKNIRYCISDKSNKILKYRFKYNQWWLALVDCMGHSLNQFNRDILRNQLPIVDDWNKIIIINSIDHTQSFEI